MVFWFFIHLAGKNHPLSRRPPPKFNFPFLTTKPETPYLLINLEISEHLLLLRGRVETMRKYLLTKDGGLVLIANIYCLNAIFLLYVGVLRWAGKSQETILSGEVARYYLWSHFPPCVYTANSKNISIANISIPIHEIVFLEGGREWGKGVEGSGKEGGINAHILLFLVKILILFAIRVTVVLG